MKKIQAIVSLLLNVLFVSAIAFSLSGCKAKNDSVIQIGSKDFTESYILAELYALSLENNGFKVERKLNLGGTNVVHAAIQKGDLDIYPEYTGTCMINVLQLQPITDPDEVYKTVSIQYKEKFNLTLLEPAKASNSQGLAISKRASEKYNIKNISKLRENASQLRFASQGAFEENADGMQALVNTYGEFKFKSKEFFDNAIKYELIKNGKADLVIAFSTDGALVGPEFVLLEDDKHAWPPYNIIPIVRTDILEKDSKISEALNAVSRMLDNETMQQLNAEVDIKKREPADVAKEFFDSKIK